MDGVGDDEDGNEDKKQELSSIYKDAMEGGGASPHEVSLDERELTDADLGDIEDFGLPIDSKGNMSSLR